MASKTHKAPVVVARTSFDLQATVQTVITKANAVLPGRKKSDDTSDGPAVRKPDTPVLFNPVGRGANGYTLVAAQARKFGATVKLEDIAEAAEKLGFKPAWSKDKSSFRVIPAVGAATKTEVNVDEYLDKLFAE